MDISKVILWKYGPGTCDFMVRKGELIWEDSNISEPTDSELNTWNAELLAEETANLYKQDRAISFPELKEQLDLLFHDMTAGKGTKDGEWYKAVSKVKTDNPKP